MKGLSFLPVNLIFLDLMYGIAVLDRVLLPRLTFLTTGITLVLIPTLALFLVVVVVVTLLTGRPLPRTKFLKDLSRTVLLVLFLPVQTVCQPPHWIGVKPLLFALSLLLVDLKLPSFLIIFLGSCLTLTQSSLSGFR